MFHYTVETTTSVQDVIAALESTLKEEQFGVLWQFSVQDKLKEKGFDFEREYVILEVCNPAIASRVLNENLLVGYFLPCKIVVYEENGKTKIGMPKPTVLMNMLGDDALTGAAADVEERLISCINKIANLKNE